MNNDTKTTLVERLDQIDEWLKDDHDHELAAVLSALRGPDSDDPAVKRCTSLPIRALAFPKLWKSNLSQTWEMPALSLTLKEVSQGYRLCNDSAHFNWHTDRAIEILRRVRNV